MRRRALKARHQFNLAARAWIPSLLCTLFNSALGRRTCSSNRHSSAIKCYIHAFHSFKSRPVKQQFSTFRRSHEQLPNAVLSSSPREEISALTTRWAAANPSLCSRPITLHLITNFVNVCHSLHIYLLLHFQKVPCPTPLLNKTLLAYLFLPLSHRHNPLLPSLHTGPILYCPRCTQAQSSIMQHTSKPQAAPRLFVVP